MSLTIEKLVYGGAGVGEVEGKKVFVCYSAPGDVLDVELVSQHTSYAEAKILKIIEPASCRVKAPCPVFGECGGCQWQHLSYEAQLDSKRSVLIETLQRIGKFEKAFLDEIVFKTLPSPNEWHYRNRIQLHVDSRGKVGFYRSKSKEVVEFKECLIADERLNTSLNEMKESLRSRARGIAIRLDENNSFAQINTEQNENLKQIIVEWVSQIPHDTILELYAGSGNFTFALSKIAKRIVASDIDGRAIGYARERQKKESVYNIEFIRASAGDAINKMSGNCDVVIIDPPRKGCLEVIDLIARLKPNAVLYISCDPSTLARDLASFRGHGYKLMRSMPIDMFPQTYHIESITLLIQETA